MNDNPKELLSRAFVDEPPLRIDRDEVIRQGRKRLRRRRFFEAGGVVAAVLVAAVGAAMLTNLSGTDQEKLPPAASRTEPPSPTSPGPATSPPTASGPETRPPSSTPGAPNEKQLLALLYDSGIVTESDVEAPLGTSGSPRFELVGDQYVYQADIIRPKAPGSLSITVDLAPGAVPDCDQVPPPYGECGFTTRSGASILLARFDSATGRRGTYAAVVLDNGVRVVATTTNLTSYDAKEAPAGRAPALTEDELCDLVARVGIGAG